MLQIWIKGHSPLGKMRTILKSNHFGKDWGFAIGIKTWNSAWSLPIELPIELNNETFSETSNIIQFESDTQIIFLPTLMVRYKNFFVGGGYLPETEYDFSGQAWNLTVDGAPSGGQFTYIPSGERKEWDLSCGYFFNKYFAVSLGYKKLDRSYTPSVKIEDLKAPLPSGSESFNAPIVGVAASVPIGKKFSFSGNLAYGWINGDADGNYYLAELGLNYTIPIKKVVSGITISAGYRFQRLDLNYNRSVGDQNDSISGFVFGANVHF